MKGVKMPDVGQVELPCTKKELIIVVGAEDHYSGKYAAPHRLMFMAQAVRQVKMTHARYDKVSVFWFQGAERVISNKCSQISGKIEIDSDCYGKYTPKQVKAFEIALKQYVPENKLLIKEAKSFDDVAAQANKKTVLVDGKTCKKKVRDMYFFGHGTPDVGFWLSNGTGHYLGLKNNVYKIHSESFYKLSTQKAQVFFYSCQTGNKDKLYKDTSMNYNEYIQKLKDESSAQFIANKWRVTVKASMRRTNYGPTWKTGFSGYWDEYTGNRTMIDGKVWEENGADAPMVSGDLSWQDDYGYDDETTPSVPKGYFDYVPK